jgi:hypothetical protein
MSIVTLIDRTPDVITRQFPNDSEAKAFCDQRWPDCEYAFCYFSDLIVEGLTASEMASASAKQIILNVLPLVADDYDGPVTPFAHILADEFDVEEAWADAYYFGALATEMEEAETGSRAQA